MQQRQGKDERRLLLAEWARQQLERRGITLLPASKLESVSGDASFRRYFRLTSSAGDSWLFVDAPPEHEDCRRFVTLAATLRKAGLHTPEVHEADYDRGFMMLEDFGDALYLAKLEQLQRDGREAEIDALYGQAMQALVKLQRHGDGSSLAPYDQALLRRELTLFDEWFCERYLGLELDATDSAILENLYRFLEQCALAQPQVCVHRDFHSRNLMLLAEGDEPGVLNEPGVIDFQDAVLGPYTYDLVSLLRDCYIVWPDDRVADWAARFALSIRDNFTAGSSADYVSDFVRDFDMMGLQRHLKVIGIFSRLSLRDGKPRYLKDIPVVINYVLRVADNYPDVPELKRFAAWFRERVQGSFECAQ